MPQKVPPWKYERRPVPTSFSPFESRVAVLLTEFPETPATVIAERVGWAGSMSWFRENVARLRPEHRRPDLADGLSWEAGDAGQFDLWFPPGRFPLEVGSAALLPVLVITAAHSRFTTGRMTPIRQTEDLLLGSWELVCRLGTGSAAADLGRRDLDRTQGQAGGRGSRVHRRLATRIMQLRPRDPGSKGIVERRNGYFETSFMPGRVFARRLARRPDPRPGRQRPGARA